MSEITSIDQVKPYKDNIIVYPVPLMQERALPSGIIIPDTQLEFHDKPRWGTVISVGSEVKQVKPADQVLIRMGAGMVMSFQDAYDEEIKEYLFVKEEHIECVFDRNDE